MSPDTPPSDGPATDAEFHDHLVYLLRAAESNGVSVGGGWACRDDVDDVGWDVEIIALQSPEGLD